MDNDKMSIISVIRCPHQKYGDFTTEIQLQWSIFELKQHLNDVYPCKPEPERQRLIYAGQLMKDDQKVTVYLVKNRIPDVDFPIIHLVYSPLIKNISPSPPPRTNIKPAPQLRHRTQPALVNSTSTPSPTVPANHNTPLPTVTPQPMMTSYNVMTNAYLMQYMQYLQQIYGINPLAPAFTGAVPPPTMTNSAAVAQNNVAIVAQQPQVVAAAQVPQAPALNAQGGMADDAELDRDRDWLDWIYMCCRAMLLLTIIYFYSSMERFTFVILCCVLLYGLQAGWFARRRQQENHINQQLTRQPPANQNAPTIAQSTNENVAAGHVTSTSRDQPPTAWFVFWSTCYTFISSFFMSLVPERPPPVNVN